jgi:hypothetical protein
LQAFQVILNWPRVTVDGCEERLDVVGFRTGNGAASDYLWNLWQYNDLDDQQSSAHIDALALGRSFLCIGTNDDDAEFPLITIESALEMATERDARTRQVTAALRLYGQQTEAFATQQTADMNPTRATLYLPDVTYWLHLVGGRWELDGDPDVHRLGVVPVVPMVNRDRATKRRFARVDGVSEMMDVIPSRSPRRGRSRTGSSRRRLTRSRTASSSGRRSRTSSARTGPRRARSRRT